jgi:hypothetical protein
MRKALLAPLVFVGAVSKVPVVFAADGLTGPISTGQAQISITIPERFDVSVTPEAARSTRGNDMVHVKSNMDESLLKYSIKKVVFVPKDGKAEAGGRVASQPSASRTQVFVVVPE